jgi:hypothetical protein
MGVTTVVSRRRVVRHVEKNFSYTNHDDVSPPNGVLLMFKAAAGELEMHQVTVNRIVSYGSSIPTRPVAAK